MLNRRQLTRAVDRAEQLDLFDLAAVELACDRNRGRLGVKNLRSILTGFTEVDTKSVPERDFIELCRDHGLPAPLVNAPIGEFVVDALWPRQRLVVEIDSYEFHRSRAKFESDRSRDALLQLQGYRVLRVTARRLRDEPAQVIADVRRLLSVDRLAGRGVG